MNHQTHYLDAHQVVIQDSFHPFSTPKLENNPLRYVLARQVELRLASPLFVHTEECEPKGSGLRLSLHLRNFAPKEPGSSRFSHLGLISEDLSEELSSDLGSEIS